MTTESNYQPEYGLDTINDLGLDVNKQHGDQHDPQNNVFSTIDDETMVSRFARGKKRSVSNHNLTISYAHNSLQLATPQGELIALNKISDKLHYILIKQDSVYWEFIHNIILDHNFVPIDNNPTERGFFRYQKYQIPQGYQLQYTTSHELQSFWQDNNGGSEQNLQLDLLFLNKSKWYRVQDISIQNEQVSFRSVAGTVQLPLSAKVAWIYRLSEAEEILRERKKPKVTQPVVKAGEHELIDKLIAKLGVEPDERKPEKSGNFQVDSEALALFEQVFNGNLLPEMSEELRQKLVELQKLVINILEHYLEHGETITRTEVINDTSGKKISEKTITTQRGCPRWAIEAILKVDRSVPKNTD